jgi:hypothetical protein
MVQDLPKGRFEWVEVEEDTTLKMILETKDTSKKRISVTGGHL